MQIGNTLIPTTGILAAIDTGTSAMLMPKSYADLINGAIPGALPAVKRTISYAVYGAHPRSSLLTRQHVS